MKMNGKIQKRLLIYSPILAVIGTVFFYTFRSLGNWLVVQDPLTTDLDVIFSFGGTQERAPYAVELQKKYKRAILLVSTAVVAKEKQRLFPLGADTNRIDFIDTCKTTWTEIAFLESWVKGKFGDKTVTVGLVSSPYHMRRIKLMMTRRKNINCIPLFLPVPRERYIQYHYNYNKWWENDKLRNTVINEVKKMIYFRWLNWYSKG